MTIVFRFVSVLFFGCLSLPALGADMDIQPWSESLFVQLEKEFGKEGAERVRKLHELMLANKGKPTDVKLKLVNDSINQLPWIADRSKYDAEDYWATPLETVATFGGDCEDMAIAKLMMLRMMGIPKEKLRLAYVKLKETGEAHMILVYIENPDKLGKGEPVLVLDNFDDKIKPGTERTDLLAVFLVSGDKKVTVVSDDGKTRSVKGEVDSAKFAKIDKIKKKIAENKIKYQQYNEGRPLY